MVVDGLLSKQKFGKKKFPQIEVTGQFTLWALKLLLAENDPL